jgi:hypothetical protein
VTAAQVATDVAVTISASYGPDTLKAVVAVVAPSTATQVRSVTASPTSITAGATATATVTLTAPAPPSGTVVTVSSDNPIATVPPSVSVPAGSTSASFIVATVADAAQAYTQTVGIRASYGGAQAAAVLFVFPPAPPQGVAVAMVSLNATSVVGGSDPVTATVTLTTAAPADTRVYFYGSAYSPVQMSAQTVLIPAGQQTGAIQLFPGQVDADYTYTLTAEVQGTTPAAASLLITP